MEPFRVHILGCGSATPTLRHYPSAQLIETRGHVFMVDCGEGAQIQLRRTHIHFSKLEAVFITHLHGDHCFGLPGLITSFGLLDRAAALHIFAPAMYEEMFHAQIRMFAPHLSYELVFHGVDTTAVQTVYETKSLEVSTIPLQHRIPCCGYLFREKPGLPHIRRDMIDFYKIPTCYINNIKNGMSWTTDDGETIPHERLVTPADPPRAYAYCSDTKYIPKLHTMLQGVTTLYHESTYCDDKAANAETHLHSTARQAAMVARDAHVRQLLIGHYSAGYTDNGIFLKEAKEVFDNTYLTDELAVFDV